MPAKSKSQQRLFGMVHQCQKSGKCASPEVEKISRSIDYDDADEFASTKHKGLPEKKKPKKKKTVKEMATGLGRYPTFAEYAESNAALRSGSPPPEPGHCVVCGRPHGGDPDVDSFCGPKCERAYHDAVRGVADYDTLSGGLEDTPSYEAPPRAESTQGASPVDPVRGLKNEFSNQLTILMEHLRQAGVDIYQEPLGGIFLRLLRLTRL